MSYRHAEPSWWINPLAYRLAEAAESFEHSGLAYLSTLIRVLASGGPTTLRASLSRLFANDDAGELLYPARALNYAFCTPIVISGPPGETIEKSNVERIGELASLESEELRQVDAVAFILVSAVMAFADRNTRIEVGGPRDLNDPGDVVGVDRIGGKSAFKHGVDYQWMRHLKGAAGKTIGLFEEIFDGPHLGATAAIFERLSSIRLTPRELRTFIDG
jgi:hypothetical protein